MSVKCCDCVKLCERTSEEDISSTKEKNERRHQLLDAVFKKHQVVLHRADVQQPPRIKEEEEELWVTQEEADLTMFPLTVVSVKTEDREDKPPESSRLQHSLNVCKEHLPEQQEWSPRMKQEEPQPTHFKGEDEDPQPSQIKEEEEDPQPLHFKEENEEPQPPMLKKKMISNNLLPHIKEEEEEHGISQEGHYLEGLEEVDVTKVPLTVVIVKREDDEGKGESEERREVDFPSSSSTQHMTTEADGDHCDKLLAPLSDSDDTTSHSSDSDDEDSDVDETCHTDNTRFQCPHCDKTFNYRCNLNSHVRIHTGEKPFMCSVCNKRFSRKDYLITHTSMHTGEKPLVCSVCGKGFVQIRNLKVHMRTHTGEKPFTCSVCGKCFSQNCDLKRHMNSHTGDKPFVCSICSKRFTQKRSLIKHTRVHTGEKRFVCSVCDKCFIQNGDLKRHMRIHTGEKMVSCSVCKERFAYKYQCDKHKCAGENSSSK
nr:gastrula zinc finger protein XlCGF48.2-like isoform X1 [Nerophis lumbriciformis]